MKKNTGFPLKLSAVFFSISLVTGFSLTSQAQSNDWVITKTAWSATDEAGYSQFVQALGRTNCANVDECLRSPANPYRNTDPRNITFYSDCADFPYFLRAYYAWKNGLPFGYVSQVGSFDVIERKLNPPVLQPGEELKPIDIRYSLMGNFPMSRRSLVPTEKKAVDFFAEMKLLQNTIQSGMLRVGPDAAGRVTDDFYFPTIRPGSIRPGTVIYDPNGHVAVVYDVLPSGKVLHFDAHPDNSVTRGMYSAKFSRSNPVQGAGFKNFRPMKLVGATKGYFWDSTYKGGQLVLAENSEIPDVSTTQFYGTNPDPADWRKGTFVAQGKQVTFHEFVRASLATEKINPVEEFEDSLLEFCSNFKDRLASVEVALKNGIHQQAHPAALPSNIYGSSGDWETYSTPGRDTRMRASFVELRTRTEDRYREWLENDFSQMKYTGADLQRDYLRVLHKMNMECPVSYQNSNGATINLSFDLLLRRLFRLSFDPYHCPELRWGASHPEELKSCQDDETKRRWYTAQQPLRNNLRRDWSAPTDITMEMLESGAYGASSAPEMDLKAWLRSLPKKGGGQ